MSTAKCAPAVIAQGALFIETTDLLSLSRCERAVATALLRCVDKRNMRKPITACKKTLAAICKYSERAVYDALRGLAQANFIERVKQPAKQRGRWQVAPVKFTQHFLSFLPKTPSANSADNLSKPTQEQFINKKQTGCAVSSLKSEKCEKRENRAVPADLLPLHDEFGIRVTGILALMALAKKGGNRLSDLAFFAYQRLRALKIRGSRAFAYLAKMAAQGRDYGYQARIERQAKVETTERQAVMSRLPEIDGKSFESRTGQVFTVRGAMAYTHTGVLPLNGAELPRFLKAIADGNLTPVL